MSLQLLVIDGPDAGRSFILHADPNLMRTAPVKPTKYQTSIPHRLEEVVLKLLAKAPADRYPSAQGLLGDLKRIGKVQGVTA